jgi:hypothetical protein
MVAMVTQLSRWLRSQDNACQVPTTYSILFHVNDTACVRLPAGEWGVNW